jgi:hypothetical protein
MLSTPPPTPSSLSDDRETRIQAMIEHLRPDADVTLRRMAEQLVDLAEDQAFGQIELTLRDLVHDLAASSHQTALQVSKKRGT